MLNYLDWSYDQKLAYWRECTSDPKLQILLEEQASKLRNYLKGYCVNSKTIDMSFEDCYEIVLRNGGYCQYSEVEKTFDFKLLKENIMPYHNPENGKTEYMYVENYKKIPDIIAFFGDAIPLVEIYYCNEGLLTSGHEVKLNQNEWWSYIFKDFYATLQDEKFNINHVYKNEFRIAE